MLTKENQEIESFEFVAKKEFNYNQQNYYFKNAKLVKKIYQSGITVTATENAPNINTRTDDLISRFSLENQIKLRNENTNVTPGPRQNPSPHNNLFWGGSLQNPSISNFTSQVSSTSISTN